MMIDAWRRSGLTLNQFARKHGTTEQRLGHWRKTVDAWSPPTARTRQRPVVMATAEPVIEQVPEQRAESVTDAARAVVRSDGVEIIVDKATPAYLASLLVAMRRP